MKIPKSAQFEMRSVKKREKHWLDWWPYSHTHTPAFVSEWVSEWVWGWRDRPSVRDRSKEREREEEGGLLLLLLLLLAVDKLPPFHLPPTHTHFVLIFKRHPSPPPPSPLPLQRGCVQCSAVPSQKTHERTEWGPPPFAAAAACFFRLVCR